MDTADFAASGTTATASAVDAVSGNAAQYVVTVSGGDLGSYNGAVGLTFASGGNIADAAGNALTTTLPTGTNYETYTLDNTAPTVTSVERHDGTDAQAADTNADSVTFRVTFSEAVENVDTADFAASGTSATASAVDAVSGNAARYVVTVSGGDLGSYDGAVGLTFASGGNIADAAGNALVTTLPTGTSYQTYTLENTAPTVTSVERHDGTSAQAEHTNADSVTFRVTFSEDVENVDTADFAASGTTATASAVTGNAAQYVVTVSGGNLGSYNGAVGLTFASGGNIADAAGNALTTTLPTGTNYETYTLDNTAPTVVSVERHDGTSAQAADTNADSVTFRVTFSEDVENVDTADFAASGTTATASAVDAVSGNAAQYVVTVSGGDLGSYNGAVGLTFASGGNIADAAGNALTTTLPTGTNYETYTLDNTARR